MTGLIDVIDMNVMTGMTATTVTRRTTAVRIAIDTAMGVANTLAATTNMTKAIIRHAIGTLGKTKTEEVPLRLLETILHITALVLARFPPSEEAVGIIVNGEVHYHHMRPIPFQDMSITPATVATPVILTESNVAIHIAMVIILIQTLAMRAQAVPLGTVLGRN